METSLSQSRDAAHSSATDWATSERYAAIRGSIARPPSSSEGFRLRRKRSSSTGRLEHCGDETPIRKEPREAKGTVSSLLSPTQQTRAFAHVSTTCNNGATFRLANTAKTYRTPANRVGRGRKTSPVSTSQVAGRDEETSR